MDSPRTMKEIHQLVDQFTDGALDIVSSGILAWMVLVIAVSVLCFGVSMLATTLERWRQARKARKNLDS